MQLETTIPLRRDGTVIVRCPSGAIYKFLMDEQTGMPACDVESDADAVWMLKSEDFYPATEEAVEAAESLLDGIEFDPPREGEDDETDDDEGGYFSETQPFDDTDSGGSGDFASALVKQEPETDDGKGEDAEQDAAPETDEDPHAVLDDLSKGELRSLYADVVGSKPHSRLSEEKMKEAIRESADKK